MNREILKDPIKVYNFPPHKRGDTVPNKIFDIKINGEPPLSNISKVELDLEKDGKIWKRYNIENNSIVINSSGIFTILSHILDISPGVYNYDLQITFENGVVKTYLRGTWEIFEDITK